MGGKDTFQAERVLVFGLQGLRECVWSISAGQTWKSWEDWGQCAEQGSRGFSLIEGHLHPPELSSLKAMASKALRRRKLERRRGKAEVGLCLQRCCEHLSSPS